MLIRHLIMSVITQIAQIAQTVDDMGWSMGGGNQWKDNVAVGLILYGNDITVQCGVVHFMALEKTQREKKKIEIIKFPCTQKETGSKRQNSSMVACCLYAAAGNYV